MKYVIHGMKRSTRIVPKLGLLTTEYGPEAMSWIVQHDQMTCLIRLLHCIHWDTWKGKTDAI